MVGVAGYLNFVYDKSDSAKSTLNEYVETVKDIENEQQNAGEAQPVSADAKSADYFTSARMNRETARRQDRRRKTKFLRFPTISKTRLTLKTL